jgi:hypothetical protein
MYYDEVAKRTKFSGKLYAVTLLDFAVPESRSIASRGRGSLESVLWSIW